MHRALPTPLPFPPACCPYFRLVSRLWQPGFEARVTLSPLLIVHSLLCQSPMPAYRFSNPAAAVLHTFHPPLTRFFPTHFRTSLPFSLSCMLPLRSFANDLACLKDSEGNVRTFQDSLHLILTFSKRRSSWKPWHSPSSSWLKDVSKFRKRGSGTTSYA